MNIVIAGDGKVGFTLAERLSAYTGNHVTIIDTNADTLTNTAEAIDVRIVQGSVANLATLKDAGAAKADLFIATTNSDERNLLTCMIAKRLGAAHTVARTRDPGYEDGLAIIQSNLGIDRFINPERAVAEEIGRLIEYPAALNIEVFARGRVEMLEIEMRDYSPLVGAALKDIPRRLPGGILIGAVRRGDEVLIPSGDTRIQMGDRVFIVGLPQRVSRFIDAIGLRTHRKESLRDSADPGPLRAASGNRIRSVMVVGGGRAAYYLAKYLNDIDIRVKIIEKDGSRAEELARLLPGCLVVQGDGTDTRLLTSESLGDMDAFVSVTGIDEENLMAALMAKRAGVSKVVAKINCLSYLDIIKDMGIDNIVCPHLITAYVISRYAKGLTNAQSDMINTLHPIVDGKAEAIEFTANNMTKFLDVPLRKLQLAPNVLVGVIVHKNEVIIPGGSDVIRAGDAVILFTKGLELTDLNEIYVRTRD
ncbi:MAG: Trk system potassium transporter TrkA [Oscillospiraceae bacterium]|jgi:trk system potassium uptake protein TrkA|nr:Trk system potassium transporter TrkA [Oscillospiraceae bacterium]